MRFPLGAMVCRLLLAVSLWHAPIPWGHFHRDGAENLAEHLQAFHPHDASLELGWHWHLILPDWGHPAPLPCPGGGSGPATTVAFDAAVPATTATHPATDFPVGFDVCTPAVGACLAPFAAPECNALLSTFLPTRSPQPTLCRLTC
uniref:Secreted protein n=1 Tax=Schlesneria paludicola TaxID=360056 RepID=A0A7C2JYY6_9PLAN